MSFFGSDSSRPPATTVRSASSRASLSATSQAPDSMQTTSPTWETVVGSVEEAGKRMSSIFVVAEDATGTPEGGIMSRLKSWWEDASGYVEEATVTVSEKLSELQASPPVPDDPLKAMRDDATSYKSLLDGLRTEVLNFSILIDSIKRQSVADEDSISSQLRGLSDAALFGQFAAYVDIHKEFSSSHTLSEARDKVQGMVKEIQSEAERVSALMTRFRRRDKIYSSISDLKEKLHKKRDKHRASVQLAAPDPRKMQDLFETTTLLEEARKEFKVTSEALVQKANELLPNKGLFFQQIFANLINIQKSVFDSGSKLGASLTQLSMKVNTNRAHKSNNYSNISLPDMESSSETEQPVSVKPTRVSISKYPINTSPLLADKN